MSLFSIYFYISISQEIIFSSMGLHFFNKLRGQSTFLMLLRTLMFIPRGTQTEMDFLDFNLKVTSHEGHISLKGN